MHRGANTAANAKVGIQHSPARAFLNSKKTEKGTRWLPRPFPCSGAPGLAHPN